jgi:hypothetical protein
VKFILIVITVLLLLVSSLKAQFVIVSQTVGDCDCNGQIDIGDCVFLINYIFNGGPKPLCTGLVVVDTFNYTVYDSTLVKKKSYMVVTKMLDWNKIRYSTAPSFVIDRTDDVDLYQRIQHYVTNGVETGVDTSYTMDFKLSNIASGDSSYFIIEY